MGNHCVTQRRSCVSQSISKFHLESIQTQANSRIARGSVHAQDDHMNTLTNYGKLCTQFYDIDKPTAPPEELAFYLGHARQANGPVLEAMCGSGRFLIPMMQAGIDLDGVDASSDMLGACQRHCAERGLEPRLYQQFLHEMNLPRKYKLVFIPSGSFNLIADLTQVREALKRLHDALLPGGRLLLEVYVPENGIHHSSSNWTGRWVKRPDGVMLILSALGNNHDPQTRSGTSLLRYELFKDGQLIETELEEMTGRIYLSGECEALLREVGFVEVRTLKLHSDQAADQTDLEVTIECRRS
jgi:SAM-dependent methyltransferase